MSEEEADREALRALLGYISATESFPTEGIFLRKFKPEPERIAALKQRELVEIINGRYYLSLDGLRACDSPDAQRFLDVCSEVVGGLRKSFRNDPEISWIASEILRWKGMSNRSASDVALALGFLLPSDVLRALPVRHTGVPLRVWPKEEILSLDLERPRPAPKLELDDLALRSIQISGYRPFVDFSADLGALTVIIGANAAGKSSLIDFLRFASFASQNPLPPEIDPRALGRMLFHVGGEERLSFVLTAAGTSAVPLRYEVEIQGPVGAAKVVRERLVAGETKDGQEPYPLVDFRAGQGTVSDPASAPAKRTTWTVPPHELALRRALDPGLANISRFQSFLASFRFYGGFDVSPFAAVRRPAQIEESPILAEDGANLSAVLHALFLEHRDAWDELQGHLAATLPGFLSLSVKTRAKGMTIGVLRERGLKEDLTLAELSDGTLRLLCWLALAVWPSPPPLMCLDEPEIGLHPRVLPTLAGALKLASARAQILIATHSPHLLSQFDLADISVMRKEEGRAVFVRPSTSEALRSEVETIGGEAIARLFLSEELEVLP